METNKEYLARLLPLLKKEIPSQWRVQSFSKFKPEATVMSYIDQRDLMDVLDAYCEYGWEKRYEEISGNVFCSIGIHLPDGTVQWRSDCGVESNTEKEKGQASDAAKRAGVNWGVGRFLYDKPIQKIATNEKKDGNNYPYCVDSQGRKIADLTTYINSLLPNPPAAPAPPVDHKAALENAKDVAELGKIWTALPSDIKPTLLTVQDNMKDLLTIVKELGDIKTLIALDAYEASLSSEWKENAKIKALIDKIRLKLTA